MRVIYDSGGRIVATEHRVDGSYTAHNLPEDYAGQAHTNLPPFATMLVCIKT